MGDEQLSTTDHNYTTCLELTLRTLQERVKEQENVLTQLHRSVTPIGTEPSPELNANIKQLRLLTAAHQFVTASKPYLPAHESLLPPLLAFFVTSKTIQETQIAITETAASLENVKACIVKEKTDLARAKLIQKKLLARITDLEDDIRDQAQKSPTEINRDQVKQIKIQKAYYDNKISELSSVFNTFVDVDLSPMLVIEEFGGPIVSQAMSINDEMLDSQFGYRGKTKKVKLHGDVRQKRIDQIWGSQKTESEEYSEKHAAAMEMRRLIEQLFNNIACAEGYGPGSYIKLERDSAAARFLVRANIAQLHPKDASKLRLVDFGSSFDE
ncbi:hypothetical protein K3495_g10154 [Podosphaera aphanis]|nr:hypothetical protein K3495_g10154 [Podosphaera aphanis]